MRLVDMRHLVADVVGDLVVIAPLVHTHLLADQRHPGREALADILATAQQIDRDRRLMAMGHGSNDVLWSKSGISAEKDLGQRGLERHGIDDRHVPFAELDADIALDPGKRIVLADRDQHIIGREKHRFFAGGNQAAPPVGVVDHIDLVEQHPAQLAIACARIRAAHGC